MNIRQHIYAIERKKIKTHNTVAVFHWNRIRSDPKVFDPVIRLTWGSGKCLDPIPRFMITVAQHRL